MMYRANERFRIVDITKCMVHALSNYPIRIRMLNHKPRMQATPTYPNQRQYCITSNPIILRYFYNYNEPRPIQSHPKMPCQSNPSPLNLYNLLPLHLRPLSLPLIPQHGKDSV